LNLFSGEEKRQSVAALLGTLLRSPSFLLVCALSLGTTLVRETFNTWTPTYFHQYLGFNEARSASTSALFPAIGAISVLLAGWLSDRLGKQGRAIVMFLGLLGSAAALFALTATPAGGSGTMEVALVGVVAMGLLGPYSYLAGALAMDFGGKQAGGTSSGLIDGIGYLGGALAGDSMARIATAFGWQKAFLALAVVCLLSCAAAGMLFFAQRFTQRDRI
jgi:OPA family glycerol-3-phosphate transporter-like MFS transporter